MSVYSETASAVSDDMRNNNPLDFEHMTYAEGEVAGPREHSQPREPVYPTAIPC